MAQWSIPFDEIAKKQKLEIATVVREFAILAFSRVIMRSPVDTGRFRANWNISYGSPDTNTSAITDPSGAGKLAAVNAAVLSFPIGGVFYLCNSLPYARVLEYGEYPDPPIRGSQKRGEDEPTIHVVGGYSKQAPRGMVRVVAAEMKSSVDRLLKRRR